jgi:uncharacterized protein (TIGR02118 family)
LKKKMITFYELQNTIQKRGIPVIKTIAVARRKAGMTHEEFIKYWLEVHAPLVVETWPGLRKYAQNHVILEPGQQYDSDGIIEMWYDDLPAMQKAMAWVQSKEGKPIRDDGDKFCDIHGGGGFWLVEEHVVKDETNR